MRRAVTALVLAAALAARPAAADDLAVEAPRTAAVAGATFATAGILSLAGGGLLPASCRWCDPPALDRHARTALAWGDTKLASRLSDLGVVALPAALAATDYALAGGDLGRAAEDVLVAGEAVAVALLATELAKVTVARRRPDALGEARRASNEDDLSFFSGHASGAFAVAGAFGTVARLRGYRGWPALYAAGFAVAAGVAYLRVAGDKHWLTDVAAGAVVGAAAGVGLPLLLHRRAGAATPQVSASPVALSLRFAF
ncbi:MAG: phosphatase PAP2 family protein [Anaeromyxobacteraceae bacterium]